MNSLEHLLQTLHHSPELIAFDDVIAAINAHYDYVATGFYNGVGEDPVWNAPGTNAGSCRIFAFAHLHGLDEDTTLACFGHYYRDDVLKFPANSDHANIRRFMRDGWAGIRFEGEALRPL
ncbi:MAG: HopJ type III effector protein [Alcanivoracaceae bacterium]